MAVSKLVAAVAAVFTFSLAQAEDGPITAKEIKESWVGKKILGTLSNGTRLEMTLKADGTATLIALGKGDYGTWRLTEDGYCATWREIRAGQERCFTARRAGSVVVLLGPDGAEAGKFTEIR